MAVELTTRYEDGFLPHSGGWMDQDFYFAFLISEGLSAKRRREGIEQRKQMAKARRR